MADRILSPHGETECLTRHLPDVPLVARVISDKFVTARKAGTCHGCDAVISMGDRVRSALVKLPGRVTLAPRYCQSCCYDIAKGVPLRSQGEFVMPCGNDLAADGWRDGDRRGLGRIVLLGSAIVVALLIMFVIRAAIK